jgi:hypothetical protein
MRMILLLVGIFIVIPPSSPVESGGRVRAAVRSASERAVYLGAGTILGSVSLLAQMGWGVSLLSPWSSTVGNECLVLGHVCDIAARHAFAQMLKGNAVLSSHTSWERNRALLSQISAHSEEEKEHLLFLQRRWLAKSTGLYPALVDWIGPCFGIDVQLHPDSTNSYSRDPANKFSQTYINIVQAWKDSFSCDFPLILTRPVSISDYLPPSICFARGEEMEKTVERLAAKMETTRLPVLVDLTEVGDWQEIQAHFSRACEQRSLNVDRIIAIQRLQRKEVGAIRLIPLCVPDKLEEQHQFLLEWISKFGLSANRVELDRCALASDFCSDLSFAPSMGFCSKGEFSTYLERWDGEVGVNTPQKQLMLEGALGALRGLLADGECGEGVKGQTASFSFAKIREQLELIRGGGDALSFFAFASHIEQIHSYISNLLEAMLPYAESDFPSAYADLLTSTPEALKALTSYAVHSAGMTSLAGILKAVEGMVNRVPRVLYGENAYFENIYASQRASHATPIAEATGKDWEEVDLLLAQFNPALRRIDFQISEYQVEKVAEAVRTSLKVRGARPLTLGIDCTLDFIDSPRVGSLLAEFQREIERGQLNVVCYRSGIKYDLFGMDNYCGAPLYMIHNQDACWAPFDALTTHPALKTDRLSLNWFCLAFKNVAPQLELYRKQIFDNTRAFLNKVPQRLFQAKGANYRIVPIDREADAAFVDIKIFGPLHEMRGSLLVAGLLTLKCMEAGHPIFVRPSLGFYHPNFSVLFSEECTTLRLTLGLDPSQVDLLVDCFSMLDTLNGSPWQRLRDQVFSSKSTKP